MHTEIDLKTILNNVALIKRFIENQYIGSSAKGSRTWNALKNVILNYGEV